MGAFLPESSICESLTRKSSQCLCLSPSGPSQISWIFGALVRSASSSGSAWPTA